MTFRTATGQTGRDAYVYEATQIANAQRELDARMRELCRTIYDEAPDTFEHDTDFHPDLGVRAKSAAHLVAYLQGREAEFLADPRNPNNHVW